MTRSNIVLIGMPGVGKSTAGVILAKLLGYSFIDTDILIQNSEGMLLSQIIETRGLSGFLEAENRVLSEVEAKRSVIATGGSAVYGREAMEHLKEIGKVVYLRLPFEILEGRLSDIKGRGVALKEGQTLRQLFEERRPLYEKYADIIIDEEGLSIEETTQKICKHF